MNHRSRYTRRKTVLSNCMVTATDMAPLFGDEPGQLMSDHPERRQGRPPSRDRRALRAAKRAY